MTEPERLERLWEREAPAADQRGSPMPDALRTRYAGSLEIPLRDDRPTLLVNFVSTIDGVVALGRGEEPGGGVISGFFEPDRFVMALLRAVADVLLVGAGTIAGGSSSSWTADHLAPDLAPAFGQWRRDMGLAPQPTTVIVTGSGEVRLGRRGVTDPSLPVVFATTPRGAERLGRIDLPDHVRVDVAGTGERLSPEDLAAFLSHLDARVVLCEGGPHLLADLVAADVADELFLTVAPQIVGRAEAGRLGLVEGLELGADDARWQELVSVKRSGEHLFLRYRRRG
ncbi:MAG TPA: dihydrofolate reductase family protein [Candidatus Limnocylindrales bacterium]|nr:dihydrofolate reductase family protein [Candidatus Limnocylindrales bacterium]